MSALESVLHRNAGYKDEVGCVLLLNSPLEVEHVVIGDSGNCSTCGEIFSTLNEKSCRTASRAALSTKDSLVEFLRDSLGEVTHEDSLGVVGILCEEGLGNVEHSRQTLRLKENFAECAVTVVSGLNLALPTDVGT